MPNSIKYSVGSESLALKKGNFWIGTGDVGKGPTSTTGYYNGVTPPAGGYTIYLNKATGGPSIYVAANDAELISLTNQITGSSYVSVGECLTYYAGQSDKMCVNSEYESIPTDGLIVGLDAGFVPSYPKGGSTWYDLSTNGNSATVYNNPTFSSTTYGSLDFDGTNEYAAIPYNSSLDFSAAQTIMIWVKPGTGASNARRNPYNQAYGGSGTITHEPSGSFNYYFGTHGGNSQPYVGRNSGFTLVAGELGFITVTRSQARGTCVWYKNGVATATATAGGYAQTANGSSPIWIGDGYVSNYIGNIYSVWVYNRYMEPDEVQTVYNITKGRFGL